MKWLLAVLVVACQPVDAVVPTPTVGPTPTPQVVYVTSAPTPLPTPWVPRLDPRKVVVAISGQEAARDRAELVATNIEKAWSLATRGRSTITIVDPRTDLAPIFLVVLDEQMVANGTVIRGHTQWLAGQRIRLINVYRTADNTQLMRVVLHELGHALGCCVGPEADAGLHWVKCQPDEVMCHTNRDAFVFSERELRQMGL